MENGNSHTGPTDRIKLNVGGKLFETTVTTLRTTDPDSLLAVLSTRHGDDDDHEPVFIDRDPEIFSVFLSLLRSGRLPSVARRFSAQELADEALYYGIESQLRSAMSPHPLSGIDASVVATIRPASDGIPTAFCAGADDGSVWIAHGGQISCYDWNLAHAGTLRTHLEEITSLRRVWPEIAAIGSMSAAGVHFYDFAGGRHVGSVHWSDATDPRVYKARVAAIADSDDSVFASFECRHKENAVLVIDKSTLKTVSEIGRNTGNAAKSVVPGKLTYLPENNLLFGCAVTSGAFGYSGYIRVWDVRSGDVVWETNEPGSGRSSRFGDSFADVDVDPDESQIFKVCSKSGDLAVADLRNLVDDPWVYLEEPNPSLRNSGGGMNSILHCYRKQVFVSRECGLEVWSRLNGCSSTETVSENSNSSSNSNSNSSSNSNSNSNSYSHRRNFVDKDENSSRGVIKSMAGGGDRLFVSREGVEGIEVWESSDFSASISVS